MNEKPIVLVPLVCPRCQAPIPAQPGEVAWVCDTCGQGLLLNDGIDSPNRARTAARPLDVFFSPSLKPGETGRPFWVARGQATINRRETYKGNEAREASAFWSVPRLFFIPAWECGLEEILSNGAQFLKSPVTVSAREDGAPAPNRFRPVVTPPEDIRAMAEFLLVSLEAERRDALKQINFTLTLDPAQLWVLP